MKKLLLFFLILSPIFFACTNLNDTNDSQVQTDKAISEIAICEIAINNSLAKRSAVTILEDSEKITYKINATKGSESVLCEEPVSKDNPLYQLELTEGEWNLSVSGYDETNNEMLFGEDTVTVKKGGRYSKTVNVNFMNKGNGSVYLEIENNSKFNIDIKQNDIFQIEKDSSSNKCFITNINPLESKSYDILLSIGDENEESVLFIPEQIVVKQNRITNTWIKNGNEPWLVVESSKAKFVLTDDVVSKIANTQFFVNQDTGNDDYKGNWKNPFKTIQKAIEKIASLNDETSTYTIYLDGNFSTTTTISSNKDINLNLIGLNTEKSVFTISDNRAFTINNSSSNINILIDNIKIENCNAGSYDGGAIYNEGNLTIENSIVSQNNASNGGGIYNDGSLTIIDSTIENNTATNGKGIYYNDSDDSSLILSGNTSVLDEIYVPFNKVILLNDSLSDTSKINVNFGGTVDNVVISKSDSSTITWDICNKFEILNEDSKGKKIYCVKPNANKTSGILAEKGFTATVTNPTIDISNYKIELDKNIAIQGFSETVNLIVKDIDDTLISNSDLTSIKLDLINDNFEILSTSEDSITIPSWLPSENYLIKVTFIKNNVKYDKFIDFYVKKAERVNSENDLKNAISSKVEYIILESNIELNESLSIDYEITIASENSANKKSITVSGNNYAIIAKKDSNITFKNIEFKSSAGAIQIELDGKCTLDVGTVVSTNGSRRPISCTGGVITLKDGSVIKDNTSGCGAIELKSNGILYMTGGEISNNKLTSNTSSTSGVINLSTGAKAYISGGKIINNIGGSNGGAINVSTQSSGGSILEISGDVEISGNKGSAGGAIYIDGCNSVTLRISGGTITNNECTATYGAGGVMQSGGTAYITGGTISNNKAPTDTAADYTLRRYISWKPFSFDGTNANNAFIDKFFIQDFENESYTDTFIPGSIIFGTLTSDKNYEYQYLTN